MRPNGFAAALATLLLTLTAHAAAPAGWFLAGSDPASYEIARDSLVTHDGAVSARLSSTRASKGFGTMMQSIEATDYTGKRMRLSGYAKTRDVKTWAGLWMRVDDGSNPVKTLAFDNMQSRPLKETTDWTPCSVVLDVAPQAKSISFSGHPRARGARRGVGRDRAAAFAPRAALAAGGVPAPHAPGRRARIRGRWGDARRRGARAGMSVQRVRQTLCEARSRLRRALASLEGEDRS